MSHPMVDLTEGWLNPNRTDTGVYEYYNRCLLLSYGVDWMDLWCDGYICPSCGAMWAAEGREETAHWAAINIGGTSTANARTVRR